MKTIFNTQNSIYNPHKDVADVIWLKLARVSDFAVRDVVLTPLNHDISHPITHEIASNLKHYERRYL